MGVPSYVRTDLPGTLGRKLEAAFEARYWTDLDDPDLVWTDLSGRLLDAGKPVTVSWTRGRSSFMSRTPQPGSLSLTLDSKDGALTPDNDASPYWPNVRRGFAVRWSAWDGNQWVRQFTGYAKSIQPTLLKGKADWTQVTLTVVDGLARVNQFGERWAWRNRLQLDLGGGHSVGELCTQMWESAYRLSDGAEDNRTRLLMMETAGGSPGTVTPISPITPAWGFGWWRLRDPAEWESVDGGEMPPFYAAPAKSYGYSWDTPGAAATLNISGPGDVYLAAAETGLGRRVAGAAFDSFHLGGGVRPAGDNTLVFGCSSRDHNRQEVVVGRPPEQLLPAEAFDPTQAPPWVGRSGGTVEWVEASTLDWVPRRRVWDPVSGGLVEEVAGPAWAVKCTPAEAGEIFDLSFSLPAALPAVAVQTRACYSDPYPLGAQPVSVYPSSSPGGAPTGSATWSQVARPWATSGTDGYLCVASRSPADLYLWGWGVYEPIVDPGRATSVISQRSAPAAWWAPGESDHLYGWAQAVVTDAMRARLGLPDDAGWLHGRFDAAVLVDDDWRSTGWHAVGWNLHQVAAVWLDGDRADVDWYLTDPVASSDPLGTVWFAAQTGFGYASQIALTVGTNVDAAASDCAGCLSGTDYPGVVGPVDDELVALWSRGMGGAEAIFPVNVIQPHPTGEVLAELLDDVGWPARMRDIDAGMVDTALMASRDLVPLMVSDEYGTVDSPNPDAGSSISTVAELEQGWVGVDASGVWVSRRCYWYDSDRDGVTPVDVVLSWCADETAPTLLYDTVSPGDDDGAPNRVIRVGGSETSGLAALVQDIDDIARVGVIEDRVRNARWQTQDTVIAVATEALGVSRPGRVLPRSLTFSATVSETDKLAGMLGLYESQPVLVRWPRRPAVDGEALMLITQVAWSTDGVSVDLTVSLSPLPGTGVPAGLLLYPAEDLYPAADLYPLGA